MNSLTFNEPKEASRQLLGVMTRRSGLKYLLLKDPEYIKEVYDFIREQCHNYSITMAIEKLEADLKNYEKGDHRIYVVRKAKEILESEEVRKIMSECSSNSPPENKTRRRRRRSKSRRSKSRRSKN